MSSSFRKVLSWYPAKIRPFCLPCNYFPKLSIIPTNWSPTNRAYTSLMTCVDMYHDLLNHGRGSRA